MEMLEMVALTAKLDSLVASAIDKGAELGWTLLSAMLVFVVGRMAIGLINKLVRRLLAKRKVEPSVKSFTESFVNVVLTLLLVVSVVSKLGVQTTTFAALLASAGVALGMALSGNLSNFAGGLIILLFKPYKVGDFIETQHVSGIVKEVQIFHTVLTMTDNKMIYIPNGALSNGIITNFNRQDCRRVEWVFGVEYGADYDRVKGVIESVLANETRILSTPLPPLVALKELAGSSVNILVRVWVNSPDYWDVYYEMNEKIYARFNAEGINFPFPQLTVHQAKP